MLPAGLPTPGGEPVEGCGVIGVGAPDPDGGRGVAIVNLRKSTE